MWDEDKEMAPAQNADITDWIAETLRLAQVVLAPLAKLKQIIG